MNCKKIQNDLIFFIEGEINAVRKSVIENHINECPECIYLYNKLKESFEIINKEKETESNPFLNTRIQEKIRIIKYQTDKIILKPLLVKIIQTAAIIILLTGGIFFGFNLGNSLNNDGKLGIQSEQIYVNELHQERIETFLLDD
jgi:predicted anti-sigma-YlaC factor YlaD